MLEVLRLIGFPGWLILFCLCIPVFAGFIKGVVEFTENWPRFCCLVAPIANRVHFCLYGYWMDLFDRLSFLLLNWIYGLSAPTPDNDGPNGAPPAQAHLRSMANRLAGDRRRAPLTLRVIDGGKTGTADTLVGAIVLAVTTATLATAWLIRSLHAGSALCTQRSLSAMFGVPSSIDTRDAIGQLTLESVIQSLKVSVDHLAEQVDGVVLEMGVSSMQLDQADRGFSYQADGTLDMRMALARMSAADLLKAADEGDIAHAIYTYGLEPRSRRIDRFVKAARTITTTRELVNIVRKACGYRDWNRKDQVAQTFQAFCVRLSRELEQFEDRLAAAKASLIASLSPVSDNLIALVCLPSRPILRHSYSSAGTGCLIDRSDSLR